LVALEKSPSRLHVDHENARLLAEGLAALPGIQLDASQVKTNIVIFDVSGTGMTAGEFSKQLAEQRILCHAITPTTIRMLTHCDVDRAGCLRALEAADRVLRRLVVAV
jgi:threonine aldolase